MTAEVVNIDERLRAAASDGLAARMIWARQMGQSFEGGRDLYTILGYNRNLTLEDILERYDRGGIAACVVDVLPNATWRGGVELVEDDTTEDVLPGFEQEWVDLDTKHKVVSKLLKADILSRLSSFSVLLLGGADGDLAQPLSKGTPGSLLYVKPYIGAYVPRLSNNSRRGVVSQSVSQALSSHGQGDATVKTYDEDPKSPRFGQPLTYELRRTSFGPENIPRDVHWTRIIHIAEGLEDDVYGPSVLERGWNLFDDLIKVTGGGAEAFFQRANQGRNIRVDPATGVLQPEEKQQIREQLELLQLGYGKNIYTRGVDIENFGSDVANFNAPADAIETQIAGTYRIPKRILTGSEMGELASSQDRENWKDQVNGRREQHAWPNMLQKTADRLIEYGYLSKPKRYIPRWGTIINRTEEEKLAVITTMCTAQTAEGPCFTRDEIRAEAGKPPLDTAQLKQINERCV